MGPWVRVGQRDRRAHSLLRDVGAHGPQRSCCLLASLPSQSNASSLVDFRPASLFRSLRQYPLSHAALACRSTAPHGLHPPSPLALPCPSSCPRLPPSYRPVSPRLPQPPFVRVRVSSRLQLQIQVAPHRQQPASPHQLVCRSGQAPTQHHQFVDRTSRPRAPIRAHQSPHHSPVTAPRGLLELPSGPIKAPTKAPTKAPYGVPSQDMAKRLVGHGSHGLASVPSWGHHLQFCALFHCPSRCPTSPARRPSRARWNTCTRRQELDGRHGHRARRLAADEGGGRDVLLAGQESVGWLPKPSPYGARWRWCRQPIRGASQDATRAWIPCLCLWPTGRPC